MFVLDIVGVGEVGDGPSEFDYAMIGSSREIEPLGGIVEEFGGRIGQGKA